MLDGTQALVDLSRIDVEIGQLEAARERLPAEHAALVEERAKAAAAVEAAEAARSDAEQEQRRHETRVQDQEALLSRLEGQQHQVKTNDAYTALLHEMDQARAAISDAETAILEAMESLEDASRDLERARAAARSTEERLAEQERAIADREKSIDQSLGNLRREREEVTARIDPKILERYAKIATRRTPAIAVVRGETCMGCRVGLPPQLILEMRRPAEGADLKTCGHCHRILILETPH